MNNRPVDGSFECPKCGNLVLKGAQLCGCCGEAVHYQNPSAAHYHFQTPPPPITPTPIPGQPDAPNLPPEPGPGAYQFPVPPPGASENHTPGVAHGYQTGYNGMLFPPTSYGQMNAVTPGSDLQGLPPEAAAEAYQLELMTQNAADRYNAANTLIDAELRGGYLGNSSNFGYRNLGLQQAPRSMAYYAGRTLLFLVFFATLFLTKSCSGSHAVSGINNPPVQKTEPVLHSK